MRQLFYISTLFFCISCNEVKKSTDFDKEMITAEVERMLFAYHSDIAKDGLTAEFKYLDTSTDFFWVPPGYKTALDYDSVRSILEQNAESFQSVEFQWDTLQIFPLSGKIANYSGIVTGKMTDTTGVESRVSIIESGTLIKRKDGWKLLSGQSATLDGEDQNMEL